MHGLSLLIIAIGVFLSSLSCAEAEVLGDDGHPRDGYVIVDPTEVVESRTKGEGYVLLPYMERRGRWGSMFSVGYSTFEPIKYLPQQTGQAGSTTPTDEVPVFGDVYTSPDVPTIELQMNVKRNLPYGSIGGEVAVAYYKNHADIEAVSSTLTLTPIRVGATFSLDNLYPEPYVIPYVSVGAYVVQYSEEGLEDAVSGTTKMAPYMNFGAQFSLDWLDRTSARTAYLDSGLQSTFAFVEARKLMKSSSADDPDLSNNVSFGGGLRAEF